MGRVEGEVLVRKPRPEVCAFRTELQARSAFLPEELHDLRRTSANHFGVGATVTFAHRGRDGGRVVVSAVLPPEGVTELGRVGALRWTARLGAGYQGAAHHRAALETLP